MSRYGALTTRQILKKYEETNMRENPEQVDAYQRGLLTDFGPDAPSLASDLPRGGTSENRATVLRHTTGSRSGMEEPGHSERFFELTDREPRGIAVDPDYKNMVKYQWAKKFQTEKNLMRDDGGHSIPGDRMTNAQLIEVRNKLMFYPSKTRLKIFDTSFDNWSNTGVGVRGHSSDAGKQENEIFGINKDIARLEPAQRRGKTMELSNTMPMGWASSTDHKFLVAKYGLNYYRGNPKETNRMSRIIQNEFDADTKKSRGNLVMKQIAMTIGNIVNARANEQNTELDTKMNQSKDGQSTSASTMANPNAHLRDKREQVEATQKQSIERLINNNKTPNQKFEGFDHNAVVVNPKIVEFMSLMARSNPTDIVDVDQQLLHRFKSMQLTNPNEQANVLNSLANNDMNAMTTKNQRLPENGDVDQQLLHRLKSAQLTNPNEQENVIGSISNHDMNAMATKNQRLPENGDVDQQLLHRLKSAQLTSPNEQANVIGSLSNHDMNVLITKNQRMHTKVEDQKSNVGRTHTTVHGKTLNTPNYKQIFHNKKQTIKTTTNELNPQNSSLNMNRRTATDKNLNLIMQKKHTKGDQNYSSEGVFSRMSKHPGTKYQVREHRTDHVDGDMSDRISSRR